MFVLLALCAVLLLGCYLQLRQIAKGLNTLIGALTLAAIGGDWEKAA